MSEDDFFGFVEEIGHFEDEPDEPDNPLSKISETVATIPGSIYKGQLLFEDNFNSSLDESQNWTPEVKFPGEPDYPFNVFLTGNHLQVVDGTLKIKPVTLDSIYGKDSVLKKLDLTEKCTGMLGTSECTREASGSQILPPIVTAKITTKKSFNFKYGRVEVRAKMPEGSWIVPEILLEPRDHAYGSTNYASGILRIGCVSGNEDWFNTYGKLSGGAIISPTGFVREIYQRNVFMKSNAVRNRWTLDYHTYALEWRPDVIKLFVNGVQYGEVKPKVGLGEKVSPSEAPAKSLWEKGTKLAPFDQMFYISIGMTIGGVNEFPDSIPKPWLNEDNKAMLNFWNAREAWYSTWTDSSTLEVDSVRVYAL